MSELSKLVGKGKKIKLGEIDIEIKPLTLNSMPILIKMGDKEDIDGQAKAMLEVIKITLKEAIHDATDEEIERIPIEQMTTLMEAIGEVNGFGDDEKAKLIQGLKDGHNAKHGIKGH